MRKLDPKLFRQTLLSELAEAWRTLKHRHPDHHFYSFGVYTAELAEYLMVTASSEEGLSMVTQRYHAKQGGDVNLMRLALRWNPCDSPLHSSGEKLLRQSDKLRRAGPDPYDDTPEADAAVQLVFNVAVEALGQLDRARTFGSGLERANLVLGIWKGDQSDEERVEFAEQLNPRSVVKRFARELAAGNKASLELARRRKKQPNED